MTNLTLVEYWREAPGSERYNLSGNTFTFDPNPRSIKKDVKVVWRIRRPGLERKIERARFRYNEEIGWDVAGSCSAAKRDELEFFAKRDSLFKISNWPMPTYHSSYTQDYPVSSPSSWQEASQETVYVVFESINFTYTEGKIDWFDYSIKLKRVHPTRH